MDNNADLTILEEEFDADDGMMMVMEDFLSSSDDESEVQIGGSRPGRSANKRRDFAAAYARVISNYFSGAQSVYDDDDFERRFRMPRRLFNRIHDQLMGLDPFVQKYDASKKPGIHPLVKMVGCFRFLAYGDAYDREDENLAIGESTLKVYVQQFCKMLIEEFGEQYLNRTPNQQERKAINKEMASKGFPGCIGSWDCKHFVWKNCPMRLAGQHQGHAEGGKKTLILEAIADHRKYIWQANFGDPGSLNDINVPDRSSIVGSLMAGDLSVKGEPYSINGRVRDWSYFLVDGIYPEWSIFVTTFSNPIDAMKKRFAAAQERVRKDVECAFGIVVQRFHVLARPLRGWYQEDLTDIVHACTILHNMIVEDTSERRLQTLTPELRGHP